MQQLKSLNSIGIGFGSLMAMASYNSFNNNILKWRNIYILFKDFFRNKIYLVAYNIPSLIYFHAPEVIHNIANEAETLLAYLWSKGR